MKYLSVLLTAVYFSALIACSSAPTAGDMGADTFRSSRLPAQAVDVDNGPRPTCAFEDSAAGDQACSGVEVTVANNLADTMHDMGLNFAKVGQAILKGKAIPAEEVKVAACKWRKLIQSAVNNNLAPHQYLDSNGALLPTAKPSFDNFHSDLVLMACVVGSVNSLIQSEQLDQAKQKLTVDVLPFMQQSHSTFRAEN